MAMETTTLGVYGQGTFALSDTLNLTAGARYNYDESEADFLSIVRTIGPEPGIITSTFCRNNPSDLDELSAQVGNNCLENAESDNDEINYAISLDYSPSDNLMAYVKYTRGYRQGLVNPSSSLPELQVFGPEKIDAYEVGIKARWEGVVPGNLNFAAHSNELDGQQLLIGFRGAIIPTGSAIQNAGASEVSGFELDGNLLLIDNLSFKFSYAYLHTELKEIDVPPIPPLFYISVPTSVAGFPSPYNVGVGGSPYDRC